MVQKKLNKKRVLLAFILLLVIVAFIVIAVMLKNKKESIEYKLEVIGYNESDINYIKDNYDSNELNKILNLKYEENLVSFSKEKYFRFDKLDEYLDYYSKTKNITYEEVVRKVNTKTVVDFYDEILDTDTSKNELMIVNKIYKLSEEYVPEDLVLISSMYAYEGKYISESILESLMNLINTAKEENIQFIVNQGYRSYADQESAYNTYKFNNGIKEADIFVARPGHSDYQTGLSFDLEVYNKNIENVEESIEYNWLRENAYKFGFIERYPKDKENITGFKFDAGRLRYVGIEASTYIYNNNITFEEYYGYKM